MLAYTPVPGLRNWCLAGSKVLAGTIGLNCALCLRERVRALHEASSDPKELRILPGRAQAQHILKTPQGKELMNAMLTFLMDKPATVKSAE